MEQSHNDLQHGSIQSNQVGEHFEPDTTKIVRRHLADQNDIITDEDISSVRISTDLPPFNEVTTGAEAATHINKEENENMADHPATPWDTVE
jgi:hypothetical protein